MSIHRHAANVDKSQQPIVAAILEEGWEVWVIRVPCDLLCWHPVLDVWQPMEVKNPKRCNSSGESWDRAQQKSQRKFLAWTDVPVVTTIEQAVSALRAHYPTDAPAELIAWARRIRAGFQAEWEATGKAPGARARVERKTGAAEGSTAQLFPIGGV